jgi:hypothetical protein
MPRAKKRKSLSFLENFEKIVKFLKTFRNPMDPAPRNPNLVTPMNVSQMFFYQCLR